MITATYPGATAQTISQSVAAPLEQQINGVENMLYMRSTSTDSGTLRLIVTFQIGTDPDQATINVNNRVQRAPPCCRKKCAARASPSASNRARSCRS